MNLIMIYVIAGIVVFILLIILSGYVKAPADKAFVISGFHKNPKILIGRAGIRIPFLERKDELLLKQISIDIKTNGAVPTKDFIGVNIDAIAKVRVRTDAEGIQLAMKNFLNMEEMEICDALTDSLQGNMREIIGTQELKELCTNRKGFGDQVQEKAQVDMNNLGIEIISCNIQRIDDEKGLINALGQDNMSQIQKTASIAKAQADRDVEIAKAQAEKESNDAKVLADLEIAKKQNDLAIQKAELKKEADSKQAEANAAFEIQNQVQQKTIQTETVNAQIARAERDAELKQKEVSIREQMLDAEIKKKADAERYKKQQEADAELYARQKDAEAKLFEERKEAEARKAKAEADRDAQIALAEGIKAEGEARAAAIKAAGLAEAEALEKKAEAMKKYGQAAMLQMVIEALPEMAKAVAEPFASIDKITVIDGGSGGEGGVNSVGAYVPAALKKTIESVKETTGIDLVEVMKADTFDAKVTRNVNVTGLEDEDKISLSKEAAVATAVVKDSVDEI